MPSKINLIGPKLKVARARRHTRDLSSLLDTFITDNPHRIEFCETSKGLEVISHFETPLPIETAAILGDSLHNLRASLGCVDKVAQPQSDRNEVHKSGEGLGELFISRCEAA